MATAKKTTNGAAAPKFDDAFDAGFKVAESVAKTNTDMALKGYETFVSMGREAFDAAAKANSEVKGFDQAVSLPKANFEAMVEAGNVFARSFETFNGRFFDIARGQVADGVAAQKAMMGAKTVQEAFEIQQDFVRKSIDRAVNDSAEFSSAWMKVATDAGQPISDQATKNVDEAKKAATA